MRPVINAAELNDLNVGIAVCLVGLLSLGALVTWYCNVSPEVAQGGVRGVVHTIENQEKIPTSDSKERRGIGRRQRSCGSCWRD